MANSNGEQRVPLQEAAEHAGVSAATLKRWAREGVIPQYDGEWTPSAVGFARLVARMRERGHSLKDIKQATEDGRLAFGFIDEVFPSGGRRYTRDQAATETGLDPALIERVMGALGTSPTQLDALTEDDLLMLRYVAAVLSAGLPLVAML